MKGGNFLSQRTLSAKDPKTLELRKYRRKNIGDNLYSKVSTSKDTHALTDRANSFLNKPKVSDSQYNIFKTPLSVKPTKNTTEKPSTSTQNSSYKNFSNTGGHRRTKTFSLLDQKKNNILMNENHLGNNNSSYSNPRKMQERLQKENFALDLKDMKSPSNSRIKDKKKAPVSGRSNIDYLRKDDSSNKIKQVLNNKFNNFLDKKRSPKTERIVHKNTDERY